MKEYGLYDLKEEIEEIKRLFQDRLTQYEEGE